MLKVINKNKLLKNNKNTKKDTKKAVKFHAEE
jgi:hypothetical protein